MKCCVGDEDAKLDSDESSNEDKIVEAKEQSSASEIEESDITDDDKELGVGAPSNNEQQEESKDERTFPDINIINSGNSARQDGGSENPVSGTERRQQFASAQLARSSLFLIDAANRMKSLLNVPQIKGMPTLKVQELLK